MVAFECCSAEWHHVDGVAVADAVVVAVAAELSPPYWTWYADSIGIVLATTE